MTQDELPTEREELIALILKLQGLVQEQERVQRQLEQERDEHVQAIVAEVVARSRCSKG